MQKQTLQYKWMGIAVVLVVILGTVCGCSNGIDGIYKEDVQEVEEILSEESVGIGEAEETLAKETVTEESEDIEEDNTDLQWQKEQYARILNLYYAATTRDWDMSVFSELQLNRLATTQYLGNYFA